MFTPRHKRFKPRKFLKLASDLINDKKYEEISRIRTSIGRAYYAAHLFTKEKMERLGYNVPDDHTVHRFVIDELMDRGDTTIGGKLDRLFEKRRIADYRMDTPLNMGEGRYCVRLSDEVINGAELLSHKKK